MKPKVTIDDLMQRLHITLKHEIEVMRGQLARNDVEVIQGIASFTSEHEFLDGEIVDEFIHYMRKING